MNQQILHDEWMEKIMARVMEELSAEESALLDQHIESCASCARELREYYLLTHHLHSVENNVVVPAISPTLQALQEEIAQYRLQEEADQIIEQTFVYESKKHTVKKSSDNEPVEPAQVGCTSEEKSMTSESLISANEEELVQQASKGDKDALVCLYENYVDRIYHYFYSKLGNADEAGDLTSETFTRAIEALLRGYLSLKGNSFGTLLLHIASAVFQEQQRGLKRSASTEKGLQEQEYSVATYKEGDKPDTTTEQKEETVLWENLTRELQDKTNVIWQHLNDLSVVEQQVLIMHHKDKLSYTDIAYYLGRSEAACKQLHYRAFTKLKIKATRKI